MTAKNTIISEEIFKVHNKDARKLNETVASPIVSVTVTSPPYFNLKDYGYKEQIGYGQQYEEYLEDLKIVFKNVYDCTKKDGTLWVIIDSFKNKDEVVPLPFDFAKKIKSIGWNLQEVIIWKKDRTVPWAHKGQMRNLFEYILFFSKDSKYNFYIDEVRDFEVLKKWWVKYPERYNPKGKTPDGLWEFDIPTQGSWGDGYIRHFCPLPEEMIALILKLTTKENDIVLDPFAGSGAVLAKADNMNRKYIGFELNPDYIEMFKNYMKETGTKKRNAYTSAKTRSLPQARFENLILNLRVLKFARVLYSKLGIVDQKHIIRIFAERLTIKATKKNAKCVARYTILILPEIDRQQLLATINKIISAAPLSKFGIESQFRFHTTTSGFNRAVKVKKVYAYTNKDTHKFKDYLSTNNLAELKPNEIIVSKIKVELNESDYD